MRRDRGRETSNSLTEVRTVLARAKTALHTLKTHGAESWRDPNVTWDRDKHETWSEFIDRAYINYYDEDRDEMIDALTAAVEALSWWERTGRTRYADGERR